MENDGKKFIEAVGMAYGEFLDRIGLPKVWDATLLRTLCECPRKFQLEHLEGWAVQESAVDIQFGQWVHLGIERFYRVVTSGGSYDDATKAAVMGVLEHSWDYANDKPLLGEYMDAWRCQGLVKYKNEKGNPAKCPYSHKGKWFVGEGPGTCGKCGSATETESKWVPVDKLKDRIQAVRAVVWFAAEMRDSFWGVVSRPDAQGKHQPLIEHHWQVPVGPLTFCGNVDAVWAMDDQVFVVDFKTTRQTISKGYFSQYEPNVQVALYNTFKNFLLPAGSPKVEGVMIYAMQVLVDGVRFGAQIFRQSEEEREEFMRELSYWLALATGNAKNREWPMNRASCRMCQFKRVCGANPSDRQNVLAEHFVQVRWDPVKRERVPVVTECHGAEGQDPA